MKKSTLLFTLGVALLGMTACSQEDEVKLSSARRAIDFRPAIESRATETTNANLSSIFVTGLVGDSLYFENVNFSKGSDSYFTSAKDYYWPGDNSTVNFYAYSPSTTELGADVNVTPATASTPFGMTLESFTPAEDIADQVDFITANASGTKSADEASGVELTFNHQLSQIEIQAKSSNDNYVYEVKGVRIGRPETTGTFDFVTSKWTLDDWHETTVYTSSCPQVTLTSDPVSIMGPSGNAMLIPQTLTPWSPKDDPDNVAREAYISVLIRITSKDTGLCIYPFQSEKSGRQYAWASIPLSGTWEAGKKYVYTLDFSHGAGYVDPDDPQPGTEILGAPIKFTVNVLDWTPKTLDDISMQTYK